MPTPLQQVQPVIALAAEHLDLVFRSPRWPLWGCSAGFSFVCVHHSAAGGGSRRQIARCASGSPALPRCSSPPPDSVLDIALACGFQSPAVLLPDISQGFQPDAPAPIALAASQVATPRVPITHRSLVNDVTPCIRDFHHHQDGE